MTDASMGLLLKALLINHGCPWHEETLLENTVNCWLGNLVERAKVAEEQLKTTERQRDEWRALAMANRSQPPAPDPRTIADAAERLEHAREALAHVAAALCQAMNGAKDKPLAGYQVEFCTDGKIMIRKDSKTRARFDDAETMATYHALLLEENDRLRAILAAGVEENNRLRAALAAADDPRCKAMVQGVDHAEQCGLTAGHEGGHRWAGHEGQLCQETEQGPHCPRYCTLPAGHEGGHRWESGY